MGGGGLLGGVTGMLFGSPQQVATPDYTGAAQATAAGNIDAARAATAANRVNQVTPYGSLNYSITGQDPYGNPTWTATQSLAPAQQQLLDYQNKSALGLGQLQEKGLGYVSNMLDQPFDTSKLASVGINPGETYSDAIMRRMQPNLDMQRQGLQTQLANQGVMPGSQAYENAMRMQQQRENDLLSSAIVQGMNTGLSARQQGLSEAAYLRNEPINTLNAVRTGSQVTGPSFVNSAQQQTTAGADYLGAMGLANQSDIANANAINAQQNAMISGLFRLGGAAMGK